MSETLGPQSREHLLQQLRRQLGRWEQGMPTDDAIVFSTGTPAIDRLLPGGGLRYGMLVEWLSALPGSGAATLSLLAAREACRAGGTLVVVDRRQTFYPPAAVAWGIDPRRLIVVRPRSRRDELWAAVQALRSPAVAATWAAIDRLNDRAFRRLQLAAQAGRTLGLVLRPAGARGQPSWADVRLEVGARDWGLGTGKSRQCPSPQPLAPSPLRRVHVRVLRCHGGRPGGWATLEIDDAAHTVREVKKAVGYPLSAISQAFLPIADSRQPTASHHDTHPLPLVAELADPAARSISARA